MHPLLELIGSIPLMEAIWASILVSAAVRGTIEIVNTLRNKS